MARSPAHSVLFSPIWIISQKDSQHTLPIFCGSGLPEQPYCPLPPLCRTSRDCRYSPPASKQTAPAILVAQTPLLSSIFPRGHRGSSETARKAQDATCTSRLSVGAHDWIRTSVLVCQFSQGETVSDGDLLPTEWWLAGRRRRNITGTKPKWSLKFRTNVSPAQSPGIIPVLLGSAALVLFENLGEVALGRVVEECRDLGQCIAGALQQVFGFP